jgi:hypothetical protein
MYASVSIDIILNSRQNTLLLGTPRMFRHSMLMFREQRNHPRFTECCIIIQYLLRNHETKKGAIIYRHLNATVHTRTRRERMQ